MAAIYFLRHGQTDYNAARRIQGILDIPINALGRSQAQRNGGVLAELISDPSRFDFVSSPLLRARQTMEIVREAMGLAPDAYRTDARLEEIRFGDWAGMTMAQVAERDPENYARLGRPTFGTSRHRAEKASASFPPARSAGSKASPVTPWLSRMAV